jgi:polyribonucleotide nucleotidyltransferase
VTGTDKGVNAIQMDIKSKEGLSREVLTQSLEQARIGRLFILGKMQEIIEKPYELSPLVPKVTVIKIDTDKIGAVIGGGGKIIREIIEKTGTTIDIEEDGTVKIFGGPTADIKGAIRWVRTLAGQIEKGEIFEGKIRKVADFGLFVELVPGQDGLVHISNIPRELQKSFMKDFVLDQVVKVEVLDHDPVTGRTSLRLLAK